MSFICYGHCMLEFPNKDEFAEHIAKVVKQRERRRKKYQEKKMLKRINLEKTTYLMEGGVMMIDSILQTEREAGNTIITVSYLEVLRENMVNELEKVVKAMP